MTAPASTADLAEGFTSLGLRPAVVATLASLGYEEPTPIQREAVPLLLDGRDVLGQAATGTGKTAAFALPMLERIFTGTPDAGRTRAIRALILVPTRELAMQVSEAVHRYGKSYGARVLPVYGGQAISMQLKALRAGVDVIVATPGRIVDHLRRGSIRLDGVRFVVLDEADEMLDMGFAEDLEAVLEALPEQRQTALFSATMAGRIASIAERHLREPVRIAIDRQTAAPGQLPRVRQVAYIVQRRHKVVALGRVLDMENPASAIIFCRTRTEVDELTETLGGRGYRAEALHGGLSQEQRDRVMRRFREGATELLIATDVAARGLDIESVSHVVNFDVPSAPDAYLHRIGRTGRAGREGVAITLAEPREHRMLRNFERVTRQKIQVETVPTIVDLRARRLEVLRGSLRETLLSGDLEQHRVVVESLAEEFDVLDVAAAAVRLAHETTAGTVRHEDSEELPVASSPADIRSRESADGRKSRSGRQEGRKRKQRPVSDADVTRIYIGLGRKAGMRPGDLVGAIANEAGIDARAIGAVDIADRFSLVEVPDEAVDEIIGALRNTTIRGKKVVVRRDRETRS
ncbi:MAG TPA: DEAD/DEAH box helicase [Gemmatimonadaceae bacterium]|nr:DEAD/DEAH box helicase [Gemmatimonadaceae bacterium]